MRYIILIFLFLSNAQTSVVAQHVATKFGKGIQILGQDSTYFLKMGFRFQNLMTHQWDLNNDDDHESGLLIRRARLKFDGYAMSPKLKYKFELGLSNRDISSGNGPEFRSTANFILDAYISWNFFQNFSIQFGQGKQPGNRERLISSGNLQFVDRSRLNSRFNLDRDVGFQLKHHLHLGKNAIIRETIAISQGEGRNVTAGYFGGYNYTFKVEALPFGKFQSKGDYSGSSTKKEETSKLAIAVAYDINSNAVRERGNLGSFIKDESGNYYGKTLHTIFVDLMYKYQNLSCMIEYVDRKTSDRDGRVFSDSGNLVGQYYLGNAINMSLGYMLPQNWEVAVRYTEVNPDLNQPEIHYTLGLSKFVVGHKLKVQSDITYQKNNFGLNHLLWRTQMDIHF